eukprot:233448_1
MADEEYLMTVPVTATTIILDKFVFVPLAVLIGTIITTVWFWTLYQQSRIQEINARMEATVNSHSPKTQHSKNKDTELTVTQTSMNKQRSVSTIETIKETDKSQKSKSTTPSGSTLSTTRVTRQRSKSSSKSAAKLEPIQKWWASTSFILAFLFNWLSLIYTFVEIDNADDNCLKFVQSSKEHTTI